MKPPRPSKKQYNQSLAGVYGEFGSGSGSRAFYLQAAMSPSDLDNVSLVSDIPGSEKWPVRELFQRDIDTERVSEGLMPYLRNVNTVRFFNPLTLTLLPISPDDGSVLSAMPQLTKRTVELDQSEWAALERSDFYRFRWIPDAPEYAVVEWNDKRSKLVAIDGQHRLFALKRLRVDKTEVPPGESFLKWRIPVVIVSFRAEEKGRSSPTVLHTVRGIFVSINTQAQRVNKTREILLSDDSINALCTQEFVQMAHANDSKSIDERDDSKIPLFFFDWRGEERHGKPVRSPAAVKTIVEIRDWFEYYLLGADFSKDQKRTMEVVPTNPLNTAFPDERLTHSQAEYVRSWSRASLLPGIAHLLENFEPYRRYISALRAIEGESLDPARSDLRRHAFDQLRFGSNRAIEMLQTNVQSELDEIRRAIDRAKREHLDRLLQEDIGMRGVACAFGYLRERFSGPPDWMEYSRRFTEHLNQLRHDGWLSLDPKAAHQDLLLHIAEDHAGDVVNYRLHHAPSALGAYVELLVAAYGRPWPAEWKFHWASYVETQMETIKTTIKRGYRKEVRPALKEKYPDGGKDLTDAVNDQAEKLAHRQAARIRRAVENIGAQP